MKVKTHGRWLSCFGVLAFLFLVPGSVRAEDLQWRVRVGLTYANGVSKIGDALQNYYESQGYDVSKFVWPVGLTLSGGPEWDFGNKAGALGLEARVGPTVFVFTSGAVRENNVLLPVGGGLRYTFLPDSAVSPYLRGGASYVACFGNHISEKTVGLDGAVGCEFMRNKRVGFGVEAGWNTAEVEAYYRSVKPIGFNASVYASFKI